MRFKVLVIGTVSILLAAGAAGAATYYVDRDHAQASDSNPGTMSLPWRSLEQAENRAIAGDTVYVRAGTYPEQLEPKSSGAPGSYITFAANPGELVILDGSAVTLEQWDGLIHIEDLSYIKVSGFRIERARSQVSNYGISVDNSDHIVIEKNSTYDTSSSGIIVWSSSNIIIDGNEVELACNAGASSENECISVGETDTFEIRSNHVHHGSSVRGEGIDAKDGSSNGRIYGNEVDHVQSVGIYVDAWDKHTHDIDVFANLIHHIDGDAISIGSEQGGLLENIRIYNNVGYSNLWTGFNLHACCLSTYPVDDVLVVNNTFHDNGVGEWGGGIVLENDQATNVVVRNNIVSDNLSFQIALEGQKPSAVTIDHNLVDGFRGYEGETRGTSYQEGDPGFSDAAQGNFHLLEGSIAIDNGSSTSAPSDDYDGVDRPQGSGYDIGAFERAAGSDPGDWLTSPDLPGFRFSVRITNQQGQSIDGTLESGCIPETACVSGAVAGRSEVFVRVVGPKPNGYLWPTLVKFSTSQVEVRLEQLSSGKTNHYLLVGASPGNDDLTGLFDRTGFLP